MTGLLAPAAPAPIHAPAIRSLWPRHDEDEIAAVAAVLRSGRVNTLVHGDHRQLFEQRFADYIGMPHAIALANGTLALELALRALNIGAGDEVIVTPRSYFASVSAIAAVGATPRFADVDPGSQNIAPESLAQSITPATRGVICVHLAGWPCDMGPIMAICRDHGLALIEDCAQAHGAMLDGRKAGSFGDAAAFSFCTDKIMSTGGEGGMLLLRDAGAWERAWSYKEHGKSRQKLMGAAEAVPGRFRWLHDGFGSNYRMTEMQAAIGVLQLAKLEGWVAARRANAALLDRLLGDVPGLTIQRPPGHIRHAYYKYYLFLDPGRQDGGAARDFLLGLLQQAGVPCGSGSCPEIYREQAFDATCWRPPHPLPHARRLGESSIMLPVDPTLNADGMRAMAERIATCARRIGS